MNWNIFLNPFIKYSERQLLILGIIATITGSLFASLLGITYDGLIDVHLDSEMTFLQAVLQNSVLILLITILLFIFGKIINAKTRFIDILNSALLFRIPVYISAVLCAIPLMKNISDEVVNNIDSIENIKIKPIDLIGMLLISILLIVLLIYAISLLFKGFKTATNSKKVIHYVVFGLLVLTAEIISGIIISLL